MLQHYTHIIVLKIGCVEHVKFSQLNSKMLMYVKDFLQYKCIANSMTFFNSCIFLKVEYSFGISNYWPLNIGCLNIATNKTLYQCMPLISRVSFISHVTFKKYKTFSVLIYSYINTSGNWKNEKLCGNTTPAGRSVFTQFWVFPILTSVDITVYQHGKNVLYFFYNIAQRTLTEEWWEIFCVDIELYQHGS